MATNPYSKPISFKEIFSFSFLRALMKALWLFFPSILFVSLAWAAFWQLSQGKDLLQRTLENQRIFATFIIAQVVWTYITWYTSDITGKLKLNDLPKTNPDTDTQYWGRMLIQMPRFLAFSCLTIMILAFFKLNTEKNMSWLFLVILLLSPAAYFFIYDFWAGLAKKVEKLPLAAGVTFLRRYIFSTLGILGANLIFIVFFPSLAYLMVLLIAFQVGLVLLLVFRKKMFYIKTPVNYSYAAPEEENAPATNLSAPKKNFARVKECVNIVKKTMLDKEVEYYTRIFLLVLAAGFIFYFSTIFSVPFSVHIGAVPFILIAFGVLLILGNGVTMLSVITRLNLHIIFFALAFVIGLFIEPHYTELADKKAPDHFFNNRQNLGEYFKNWVDQRKAELEDSTNGKEYPLYFVLADGGASRSGYWSASALASLDSQTNGKFSRHIFCLSGASGGSVGNATYFNMMRALQSDSTIKPADEVKIVQDYLETDFLTFTIARMLGPDVFRHVFPLKIIKDRAAALAKVMETGAGDACRLNNSIATCFSEIITQKNKPYALPILCINTTRMQDGRPTVISNIDLTDPRFNMRFDFLDILGEKRDIKMSTSVVLGASFPYLSPAGRIDDSTGKEHYFVDGGYFDNSGSGVVSEMINILSKDPLFKKYESKLKIYVVHATNSPQGDAALGIVNPLVNDLAAPVKTLVGAYGTQTIVNDQRLWNLLKLMYPEKDHYLKLNLYDGTGRYTYPMDWVISDKALYLIKQRLYTDPEITDLAKEIMK